MIMKKIKFATLLVLLLSIGSSCSEEKLELYTTGHYMQFTNATADTTIVSFFLYPEQNELIIPIELRLIGPAPEGDLPYSLRVVKEETTAPNDYYSFNDALVFRQGLAIDTAFVTFYNKPDLKLKKEKITFEIVATDGIMPGQTGYTKHVIYFSDIISKPDWWTYVIDGYGLGVYDDYKYRLFLEITDARDFEKLDAYVQRNLMLEFKYYLIEQKNAGTPVLDSKGNDMLSTIRIIG